MVALILSCILIQIKAKALQMYRKYRAKIVSKFLQNTRSDSNFNQIYDYDYGMQGLS